ncbi:expressed unknown protein [Seminavis robusta]|uniref:Uncharacterized protein n=1 Tax=Seminavis robusta TaxID=568900 RepID=A0A9N8HW92_9STRA|nr:expressed unknown protein [Seminavis robusta]|eukprot:Sro1617_g286320.1 n/a (601) ;mRNA; f:13578-15380
MSDHGEKPKIWTSFRQRLSARRASAKMLANSEERRGSRTKTDSTGAGSTKRFSRMKDEYKSTSCLPVSHRQVVAASLLCSAKQQFKLLDDDTFSTKPLIGFASRYSNRHYSEVWLADYVNATKHSARTPPRTSSRKKTQWKTTKVTIVDPDESSDPALEMMSPVRIPATNKVGSPQGSRHGIGREIDRLSRTLGMAPVDNGLNEAGRTRHVNEFDVASATSHTSSLDTAEFSFQADFSQLQSPDRNDKSSASMSSGISTTSTWDEIKRRKSELFQPILNESYDNGDIILAARPTPVYRDVHEVHELNHSVYSTDNNMGSPSRGPEALEDDLIDMNLDILARHMDEEAMMYQQQQPFYEIQCKSDESHNLSDISDSAVGLPIAGQSDDQSLNQGEMMERYLSQGETESGPYHRTEHDRHPVNAEEHVDRPSTQQEENVNRPRSKPTEHEDGLLVQEEMVGQFLSTEEKAERPVDQTEIPKGASPMPMVSVHRSGDVARKARCVVVYDKELTDSERMMTFDDIPANVKQIVDRLEVFRQREATRAEQFGFKNFIPIHEDQKVTDQVAGGSQFFRTVSYSFESEGSMISVSPLQVGNSQLGSF